MYLTYHNVGKLQGSFITNIDLFLLSEIEMLCVCTYGLMEVHWGPKSETTMMCFRFAPF